ncbi:MAG: DUF1127 domain-containing protein [Tagaea sp.]
MWSEAIEGRVGPGEAWVAAASALKLALLATLAALILWQERSRQRAHLAELPDEILKDMGMSRGDALREAGKLPWRA